MTRFDEPTSPRPDDEGTDASLVDAALSEVDSGQAVAPGRNPYDEVVTATALSLIPPASVRPDLAARIAAVGIERVRSTVGVRRTLRHPAAASSAAVGGSVWMLWSGWAVAAAACLALGFVLLRSPAPSTPGTETVDLVTARQQFISACGAADEMVRAEWSPGNTPDRVKGDVVWSDRMQRGYLRLAGLPKNDPEKWVYQLWIFDATGDDRYPVDGGVFSIAQTDPQTGEAVIEIDPKVKVGKGVMFAVTIEKPGGVPVSDRSKIVALAKVS